jgi:hypothetical protein
MASNARMNPTLEYERIMNISQPPPARQSDHTRTSLVLRVLIALAACLLFMLGFASMKNGTAADPVTWAGGLLAGASVFFLADILLAFLVVAIPPGLFILSLVALLAR